ncbi:MAG: hypothetical protein ACRD5J_18935 [Nitrososphaeraceae archaeon]
MNPLYTQKEKRNNASLVHHKEGKEDSRLELDNWINKLTSGSSSYFRSLLLDMVAVNSANAELLCKFLSFEGHTYNIKQSTKETHIKIICWFDPLFHAH